jgi:hypothetical protein
MVPVMTKSTSLSAPDLPEAFREIVKPYLGDEPQIITDDLELITLWKAALIYGRDFPQQRDAIAKATVEAASSSPLVEENGIFETIHILFRALINADPSDSDEDWAEVEAHVNDLSDELLA